MRETAFDRQWETRRLRDAVTKLVDGSHNPPAKQVSGRPMLSARNVEQGRIVFDEFRYISDEAFAAENVRTRIEPNDVLLTIVGTIGRSAVVPFGTEPFALQRSVAVLTPKPDLSAKFLSYQLQSPRIQRHFEANARGTAQKGVYLKTLGETPIHAPSLDEQHIIVAEIEKQFSRLDEAISGLQRAKANLKRYKAAVLKSAVAGRLVETEADLARREGRDYETGAQLLQRILATRRSQWQGKGKYKEPAAPDTTDLPELPEGWVWGTADQVCSQITDGEHIQPSYQTIGFPMLTAKNVRDGFVDFGDVGYIAKDDFDACLRRCAPAEGDLLIVSVGATTGRTAIVGRCQPFALVRSVLLLRPISAIPSTYLLYWLQSPWCQTHIQRASGATAQAHLYIKDTRVIPVPLPPLPEQHRIVAEVDRLLSIAREAEAEVEANLKRAQGLRQAILQAAFSSVPAERQ